jgi:hypothetical protein
MEAEHKIISNNPVADGVPSPTKEVTMADARLGTFRQYYFNYFHLLC